MHGSMLSSIAFLLGITFTDGQSYTIWQWLPEASCGNKIDRPKECDATKALWGCQSIIDRIEMKMFTGYSCVSMTYEYHQKRYEPNLLEANEAPVQNPGADLGRNIAHQVNNPANAPAKPDVPKPDHPKARQTVPGSQNQTEPHNPPNAGRKARHYPDNPVDAFNPTHDTKPADDTNPLTPPNGGGGWYQTGGWRQPG